MKSRWSRAGLVKDGHLPYFVAFYIHSQASQLPVIAIYNTLHSMPCWCYEAQGFFTWCKLDNIYYTGLNSNSSGLGKMVTVQDVEVSRCRGPSALRIWVKWPPDAIALPPKIHSFISEKLCRTCSSPAMAREGRPKQLVERQVGCSGGYEHRASWSPFQQSRRLVAVWP